MLRRIYNVKDIVHKVVEVDFYYSRETIRYSKSCLRWEYEAARSTYKSLNVDERSIALILWNTQRMGVHVFQVIGEAPLEVWQFDRRW